ncbi:MAG: AMP-binding protein [Lachnospiraceae bacterium]|nr:AMP-binding protein [Lachnospiraceae bacterium]MCM1237862.1 AMP-binding protein [Lachnospiraceae bacterium]
MICNVTDHLEQSAKLYPMKTAFVDTNEEISYIDMNEIVNILASHIINTGCVKDAVAVFLPKGVRCIVSFMAVAKGGNFYSPIDVSLPAERINKIIEKLRPQVVITDFGHKEEAEEIFSQAKNFDI